MVDFSPSVQLNLNLRGLPNSATVSINERSNALIKSGRQVFKLGLGQSPFPVPEYVVARLREHAHEKDYLPVRGLPALREVVANYHAQRESISRTGEDVLIGPGSKELMFLIQLAFYGDLVIPTPAWVSYAPQAQIIGRRVRLMTTRESDGWRLRPDALEEVCREDADRPRLVILNYPANPTGGSFADGELQELAEVARRYKVVMLSDEIYGELHHRGEHVSIARYYPEGTIISSGLSKWCGAGGWRLGTFLFPPNMHWLLGAMASAASETFTSTSAPIQYAAVAAFEGAPEIEAYLDQSRRILRALGGWIAARFRAADVRCETPDGAFYLFPNFESHADRLAERGIHDSPTMCERLLEDTGVAVLPGSDFGRSTKEFTLRLAYVDFDGTKALAAAGAVDHQGELDEGFVRQYCPRVCDAIDGVIEWLEG